MEKELPEYINTVQAIEADQRTDLAVHLYSAHLLHNVNPSFPHYTWASWPKYSQQLPDPTCKESFEDTPIDKATFGEPQVLAKGIPEVPGYLDDLGASNEDALRVHFKRTTSKVRLKHKYRQQTGPKAVLLNEMHALLKQRIRMKLKEKCSEVDLEIEDSKLMKVMAIKLANRVSQVTHRLKKHRLRQLPDNVTQKNWQDLLICDLQVDKVNGRPNLLRARKLYEKCRSMFHDARYKYEYDTENYTTETRDENNQYESVPEFDVMEHLEALQTASNTAKNKTSRDEPTNSTKKATSSSLTPLEQLQRRQADFKFKERMYLKLWDQAAEVKQLAWDKPTETVYTPHGIPEEDTTLKKYRHQQFNEVALTQDDFTFNIKQ